MRKKRSGGSWIDRAYRKLGDRLGKQLFDEVRRGESLRPRLTPSVLLAGAISIVIHAITAGLLVFGLILVIAGRHTVFFVLAGVFLLGLAWLLRPRFGKRPADAMDRSKAPALHEAADLVAKAIGGRPVDGIQVQWQFNASFAKVGIRRQSILGLGLPLVEILDADELAALLGHELGHAINGDPTRGLVVGTAMRTLVNWVDLLRPSWGADHRNGPAIALPALVFIPLLLWTYLLLLHLSYRASQRAEYLADELSIRAGGTDAASRLVAKASLGPRFYELAKLEVLNKRGADVLDRFREEAASASLELDGPLADGADPELRLDATHPPNRYRASFIRSRPHRDPGATIAPELFARVQAELASSRERILATIEDRVRATLYR